MLTCCTADSFGPPPKHTAYYPNAQSPRAITAGASSASSGLGGPVPKPARANTPVKEEEQRPPPGPYQVNTTGLRTDNLPKPPGRKDGSQTPSSASPAIARPVPSLPPRQSGPPPGLPPRQSETPNEFTPPPPPSYGEATRPSQAPAALDTGAINRLGQAGVSVPGFGIGAGTSSASPSTPGHAGQMNELQQRFARMNNSSDKTTASPVTTVTPSWKQAQALHNAATTSPGASAAVGSAFNAASQKKKPPPPPKKPELHTGARAETDQPTPPPVPMFSKPRPG